MPRVIPVTLIGVLAGRLWASALHDHLWWPYLFSAETGTLKSKVTAIQRSEAMNFYHSWANQPPKFTYATIVITALILLSLLAAVFQKPTQKLNNSASLLFFLSFIGIQALKVVPQIPKFQYHTRPTPDREAAMLFDLAFWNALSLAAVVGTIFFQIVAEDEETDVKIKKKKKVRAEVVEVKKD